MRIETPRIYLPRTGQTTSYAAGDDGYYQAGNPRATRFVDNGNGTISDRATGLQWVKDPTECGEVFYTGEALVTMNWLDAIAACEGLEYAGYSDWRLPNIKELQGLTNITRTGPALYTEFFPNAIWNGSYWASSTYVSTTLAWYNNNNVGNTTVGAKTDLRHARPVRGGRVNG